MRVYRVEPVGYNGFKILKSSDSRSILSMIPPDIAICDECIKEIEDPSSRWYRYPFNSCAYCGPRFSMIYKIPYDRENTSMNEFPLCSECKSEYEDINNIRRYHAQGISCPKCGPRLWLTNSKGDIIDDDDPIKTASELIREGCIVAIKGLGGFHIACRADNDEIVNTLRIRKKRPMKPFALMARDLNVIEKLAILVEEARELLTAPQRPIVLLPRREDAPLSKYVAPGLDTVGVMLPYTGIHYMLLKEYEDGYMIMTSGNYYNKPMEIDNESALKNLSGIVDYFLLHNRRIVNRVDDSVIRFTSGRPVFLRRGRGYAPRWIETSWKTDRVILSFGADLQNTFTIYISNKAIISQYIGDLEEFETLEDFEKYLNFFIKTYGVDVSKSIIVADKHPKYLSRYLADKWRDKYTSEIKYIQHHVAHSYAVLGEYSTNEGIVIAIDGVGYGDDGMIWGGEVIHIRYDSYERIAHLEYHKMPGGDLATIYPIRMLISILSKIFGFEKAIEYIGGLNLTKYLRDLNELDAIKYAIKNTNLMTSSMGRFLDAVSTLLDICGYRSYEGEPAMKLEAFSKRGHLIDEFIDRPYYLRNNIIRTSMIMKDLIDNLENYRAEDLAYTVQYVLGYELGLTAVKTADLYGYSSIYISGGAAVNDIIIKGVLNALSEHGLKLKMHYELPPGDGSISFGQACAVVNGLG